MLTVKNAVFLKFSCCHEKVHSISVAICCRVAIGKTHRKQLLLTRKTVKVRLGIDINKWVFCFGNRTMPACVFRSKRNAYDNFFHLKMRNTVKSLSKVQKNRARYTKLPISNGYCAFCTPVSNGENRTISLQLLCHCFVFICQYLTPTQLLLYILLPYVEQVVKWFVGKCKPYARGYGNVVRICEFSSCGIVCNI